MDHSQKAAELFLSGRNCSQAVVLAFSDVTHLEDDLAARLSSPFGGGMGRMREVCGAVSGMLMVLGLVYGYDDPGPQDREKKALYQTVQTLSQQFRDTCGSIICREILKNPPSDPAPSPRTAEYYRTRPCVRMVMTAAGILDDYLAQHPLPANKEEVFHARTDL